MQYNNTTLINEVVYPPFLRLADRPWLTVSYCMAYGLVFLVGLVGNIFVVAAVAGHKSMRNITNYFILNMAIADLLIIVFCVPATLMNSLLSEWHLGDFLCRFSIWVNSVATGASVFTLVAVTADRFAAIVYTMRYTTCSLNLPLFVVVPAWLLSSCLYLPWFFFSKQVDWSSTELVASDDNQTIVRQTRATLCMMQFPSQTVERSLFVLVTVLAYCVPLIIITLLYTIIFSTIFKRSASATMAVDQNAQAREHRMRVRITVMMLSVIIVFACSWAPLYSLFTYFKFGNFDPDSSFGMIATSHLRPIFQWLSLANSCMNPILYSCFSLKFREAFRKICLLPFRRRYQLVRQVTTRTLNRYSNRHKSNKKGVPPATQSTPLPAAELSSHTPDSNRVTLARKLYRDHVTSVRRWSASENIQPISACQKFKDVHSVEMSVRNECSV